VVEDVIGGPSIIDVWAGGGPTPPEGGGAPSECGLRARYAPASPP